MSKPRVACSYRSTHRVLMASAAGPSYADSASTMSGNLAEARYSACRSASPIRLDSSLRVRLSMSGRPGNADQMKVSVFVSVFQTGSPHIIAAFRPDYGMPGSLESQVKQMFSVLRREVFHTAPLQYCLQLQGQSMECRVGLDCRFSKHSQCDEVGCYRLVVCVIVCSLWVRLWNVRQA